VLGFHYIRKLSPNLGHDHSLCLAKSWLRECNDDISNHVDCGDHHTGAPKRLLDLRHYETDTWRLISTHEAQTSRLHYTTISYRWGQEQFPKLTKSRLFKYQRAQPISVLPRLFQDAIRVTRFLGFDWIWIDALCTMQDSEDDFATECANMSLIYANSSLNLVANTASHPHESLFPTRNLRGCHIGSMSHDWTTTSGPNQNPISSIDSIVESDHISRDYQCSEVISRGWIMQELILAKRKLYFGESQLLWECCGMSATETFPHGTMPSFLNTDWNAIPKISKRWRPGHKRIAVGAWSRVVAEYSKCELTFEEDKLVAVAGVAKAIGQLVGDKYYAGLWRSELAWQLNWSVDRFAVAKPRRRTNCYVGPTW
jgi:hypothetical protein